MDDRERRLRDKLKEILKPHYAQLAIDQARLREAGTIRRSSAEFAATAEDMRIGARVWAGKALLAVLTNDDLIPMEPEAFDVLQNHLVRSLAEDAAECFSMSGFPGVPNYHDEIRGGLLKGLPQIAWRASMVNRRRYLGAVPVSDPAAGGSETRLGAPGSAAESAKDRVGVEPAMSEGDAARTELALAAKRQDIIMPLLKKKRWTRGKWVTKSGVGKNCVYEYLKGKRNPGDANRKAMADALGLTVDELPK